MIKLDSLDRWSKIPVDGKLVLPDTHQRRIRLNVNAAYETRLYLINDKTGEIRFLARVVGNDVVEFVHEGKLAITTDAEDTWLWSAETEPTYVVIPDAEVFTEIIQRRARNPEMEAIAYKMELNIQRRINALEADAARRMAVLESEVKAARNADNPATTDSAGGGQVLQSSDNPAVVDTSGSPSSGASGGTDATQ